MAENTKYFSNLEPSVIDKSRTIPENLKPYNRITDTSSTIWMKR